MQSISKPYSFCLIIGRTSRRSSSLSAFGVRLTAPPMTPGLGRISKTRIFGGADAGENLARAMAASQDN
ncbi:hypothetical protein KCU59_g136, partial [Aureobasidium melanogenum]